MSGTNSLGRLTLDLVLRAGAFTAGMTGAERHADKSLSAIEKRAYKFGQVLGTAIKSGAVIATAALTSVAVAVGQAIDRADEMRDLSIRTGIATEKLSEYAYAAKQTGTDIDGLGRGLKILAKNAAEAADATSGKGKLFEALGINVKDAHGNLKQLDALLPEVADKFRALEDGTTKAALAQELFGKSGLDLIEFLNQGSDGLDTAAEKARALGIIISSETSEAADKFNDRIGDLRAASEGFALQLAAKLLPQLIELVDKVNEFVGDGENATKVVNGLSKTFDVLAGVFGIADRASGLLNTTMSTMIGLLASAATVAQGLISLDFSKIGKGLSGGIAALQAGASQAVTGILPGGTKQRKTLLDPNRADFSGVRSRVLGQKSVEEMLDDFLNGTTTTPKGKKGGSGKSDAVKEADKLKAAYDRMNESLSEQIGTFGLVGEAAKLRYELEHGELSKLTDAEKEGLIAKAERIDLLSKEADAEEALVKARSEQDRDFNNVNDAIKEQIDLVGMSRDEMEIYNNLLNAGVTAESARGQEIIENTRLLQEMSEAMADQVEAMDAIRDGSKQFLKDFITGSKSLKDSFLDALDAIEDKLLDMVLQNFADQIFGKQGDPASGGSGGGFDWAGLIASFFGGARASGGSVGAGKFYRINEDGPEMLSVSGKEYLMMGPNSGSITPNHKLGVGAAPVTQNFYNPVMADKRSTSQLLMQSARELQRSTRNG